MPGATDGQRRARGAVRRAGWYQEASCHLAIQTAYVAFKSSEAR